MVYSVAKGSPRDTELILPTTLRRCAQQVWLPNTSMPANAGGAEAKAVVVGMTRLLAEYRELQQGNPELWGALLAGIVAVAAPESTVGAGRRGVGPEEDEEDVWEKQQAVQEVSGEAVFSKLHFASAGDHDFFPQVPDPLAFLAQQLASLVQSNPAGAFAPVVAKALNPSQLAMLQARGARIH